MKVDIKIKRMIDIAARSFSRVVSLRGGWSREEKSDWFSIP